MVVHWYTQMVSLVLPSLKADLHLTDIQVGTITATQQGVSSGGMLPSGFLAASRRGCRGGNVAPGRWKATTTRLPSAWR